MKKSVIESRRGKPDTNKLAGRVLPNNKLPEPDDVEMGAVLHDGLDRMDRHIDVLTPELDWFEQQIRERQAHNRNRLFVELSLFLVTAVMLLSLLISVTLWMPVVFVIIELTAVLIVPIVWAPMLRKRWDA